jgi:beta-lactamase class A
MTSTLEKLNAVCDSRPFTVRYFIKNLRSGEDFSRGGDQETPSASTRKISIMMAALNAVHEGRLDLAEPIVYEERLREQVASGVFRYLTPGITLSLRDAIVAMIVLSDNVCTKMVLERLTLEEVDTYCKSVGMVGTHHRFLIPPLALAPDHALEEVTTTTANDQGMLMEAILAAQASQAAAAKLGSSVELCAFALKTLKQQVLRYGIHARLPFETEIASKSGRGKRGRMDVGAVFHNGLPLYIIAAFTDNVAMVLSDGTPGYTASLETIGKLSRISWEAFCPSP